MADTRGEPPTLGGAGSDGRSGVTPAPSCGRGLDTLLASGIEAATVVAMLLQVGSVAAGVFCRYVLHRPLAGADEIATLGLVWLTFLGGAVAQRRHAHPRVSLGLRRLASSAWVDASTQLVEILFFAGVCWQSLGLCRLRLGEASAGIGFDMSLYPLAVPSASRRRASLPWGISRPCRGGSCAPCWQGQAGSGWAARCSCTSRAPSSLTSPRPGCCSSGSSGCWC